jgi:multiple sugar transport system permease protein
MKKDRIFGYRMIIPASAVLLFISIYPLIMGIYYSFTDLNLTRIDAANFIGFQNFINLLTDDPKFISTLGFTVIYALSSALFAYIIGLTLAHLLNRKMRFIKTLRVLFLIPWIMPPVLTVICWKIILSYQYGIVNKVLTGIGIIKEPILFFSTPRIAQISTIAIRTWVAIPFMTIMLVSALQTIPEELYEAARIDGAGFMQSLFNITLPMIRRISLIVTLLMFIHSFNGAELVLLLTGGGPLNATNVLPVYTYQTALISKDLGYASSIAFFILTVMMIISIFYLRVQDER